MSATPEWTEVKTGNQYTPPEKELVWTTDGTAVRRGSFETEIDALVSRSEESDGWKVPGKWTDETGAEIEVTHWIWLQDWKDGMPPIGELGVS